MPLAPEQAASLRAGIDLLSRWTHRERERSSFGIYQELHKVCVCVRVGEEGSKLQNTHTHTHTYMCVCIYIYIYLFFTGVWGLGGASY